MRFAFLALLLSALALPAWDAASAEPGSAAERVSRASALGGGYGAVVISVRSEIYLDDPLQVYFLRDGGSIANDNDVVRFERRQGFFAFGNDTLEYKVAVFALPAGTYRLVAHGMNCPKIPAEDERCLIDVQGLGGSEELSRPSRGYGDDAPRFEVRERSVTYAGDFALTARNSVEWSPIPEQELRRIRRDFARLPEAPAPFVPDEYKLKYGLTPRHYEDDRNRRY
ncbi:hypothetical protein [Qipengyuania sp. ASV99]|uniref:hypothetical protein n=1 Tax=Qipengyuania sp. ASV99 TaxID=3399681 RepID=UPI003A4C50D5